MTLNSECHPVVTVVAGPILRSVREVFATRFARRLEYWRTTTRQSPYLRPTGNLDDRSRATSSAARRVAQLLRASGVIVRSAEKRNTTASSQEGRYLSSPVWPLREASRPCP